MLLRLAGKFGESSGCGVSVAVAGALPPPLSGSAKAAIGAAVRTSATAVEARNWSRRTPGIAKSPHKAA
jgi:hypothetical protein